MHALVTFVAKFFIIIPFLCALLVFWRLPTNRERARFIIFGVITGVVAIVLAKIGSKVYFDPRPFVAHHTLPYFPHGADNGFPSDHTLLSFALAFISLRFSKRLGWIAIGAGTLVGIARVIAGVHHASDIIGSIIFAGIGAGAAIALGHLFSQKSAPGGRGLRDI